MYDKCLIVCASGSLGECELPVVRVIWGPLPSVQTVVVVGYL